MSYIPSISNSAQMQEFSASILNGGLIGLRPVLEEAHTRGEAYLQPESMGFYAGLAVAELIRIFRAEGCITRNNITTVFKNIETIWLNYPGIAPKKVTNLLSLEMMLKNKFNEAAGLGRDRS